MKTIRKLLAAAVALSVAAGLGVSLPAQASGQNTTYHEAVVFEDDFTGSVPLWYNYNTNNNDKRVLTINQNQFDWAAQDYTGWFYANVAHVTTLNIAPFENKMEKDPHIGINQYALRCKLGKNFRIETTYDVEHYLQRVSPADGEFSLRTVAVNDFYALEYSLERDGIWVLDSTGAWSRKLNINNATGEWNTVVTVNDSQAEIAATYNNVDYNISFEMPTLAAAQETARQLYYGTKVIDQTRDGNNVETWENYAVYDIKYSKISNLYENDILVDDMQSEKTFATYANLSVQNGADMTCGSTKRLRLTDPSNAGAVIYSVPASNKMVDFNIVKLEQAGYQAGVSFTLIGVDNSTRNIPASDSVQTVPAFYLTYDWTGGGFMYYYEANDELKALLASGDYTAMQVWTGIGTNTPGDGLFPSFVYADIQYKPIEDAIDQENQPVVPSYSGDVIIDDDFSGSTIDWYSFRVGIIDTYHDAIQKDGNKLLIRALGVPTISPRISTVNGSFDEYALNSNIRDNYAFEMSYTADTFLASGDPSTTGDLSDYAKVNNGKYLLYFTSEKDGIWAYTSSAAWEKIIPADLKYGQDYNIKAIVNGQHADIYLSYTTPYGKSRIYTAGYTMPSDETFDAVSVGIKYDTEASGNNASFRLDDVKLTNIASNSVFSMRGAASDPAVSIESNAEISAVSNLYRGITSQYDLIDPSLDGVISFEPGGYIRDFGFTRRLGGTYQGDITYRLTDENGTVAYLAKGTDFKEEVGGFYNDGHLYFSVPTDAYKATLASRNFVKIEAVLLPNIYSNYPADGTFPGLVSAYIEYEPASPVADIEIPLLSGSEEDNEDGETYNAGFTASNIALGNYNALKFGFSDGVAPMFYKGIAIESVAPGITGEGNVSMGIQLNDIPKAYSAQLWFTKDLPKGN